MTFMLALESCGSSAYGMITVRIRVINAVTFDQQVSQTTESAQQLDYQLFQVTSEFKPLTAKNGTSLAGKYFVQQDRVHKEILL